MSSIQEIAQLIQEKEQEALNSVKKSTEVADSLEIIKRNRANLAVKVEKQERLFKIERERLDDEEARLLNEADKNDENYIAFRNEIAMLYAKQIEMSKKKIEEEEEEEVDEVIRVMYEGKKYLRSVKTGVIYNMEEEEVGKWNSKTKKIDFDEVSSDDETYESVDDIYEEEYEPTPIRDVPIRRDDPIHDDPIRRDDPIREQPNIPPLIFAYCDKNGNVIAEGTVRPGTNRYFDRTGEEIGHWNYSPAYSRFVPETKFYNKKIYVEKRADPEKRKKMQEYNRDYLIRKRARARVA